MSEFVLDRPAHVDGEPARIVAQEFGLVSPYISEIDHWVDMPVRLIHDEAGGFGVEVGPYVLDGADVDRISEAIESYWQATS